MIIYDCTFYYKKTKVRLNMELPRTDFLREMNVAVTAAVNAGEKIMQVYRSQFSHTLKKDAEPVTEADILSNEIILHALTPLGYPILSEESADDLNRLQAERVWIVDPLDGTSDFVNRTGEFSVMIALVDKGVPVLGVVFCPSADTLYIAQIQLGAYKRQSGRWQAMSVSATREMANVRAVVSRHHLSDKEKEFLKMLQTSSFLQKGSSGLKIAEIADGRAELYFTMSDKIRQWDTCAACCIIREAGGTITDMRGEDILYNTAVINHANGILVTNGCIQESVLKKYTVFKNLALNSAPSQHRPNSF